MAMYKLVMGIRIRAKLSVIDASAFEVLGTGENGPTFVVEVLPASAAPSTPFYRGREVYRGDDIQEAWLHVIAQTKVRQELPEMFRRYSITQIQASTAVTGTSKT